MGLHFVGLAGKVPAGSTNTPMIEGWRNKTDSVHLRFGSLYHTALENFDKYRALGMVYGDALAIVVTEILMTTWGTRRPLGQRPQQQNPRDTGPLGDLVHRTLQGRPRADGHSHQW